MLPAEGYDVMLLPVVLGSAGTHLKCLDLATIELAFPKPEENCEERFVYTT
jgi:hypothetical protein